MKIAFISRATLFKVQGGDTVQMLNTARELRNLGVEVEVFTSDQKIDYHKFDLLHFFNIIRPADILVHVEQCKLPYVISPIYVDYSAYEKEDSNWKRKLISSLFNKHQIEYLKVIARWMANGDKIPSRTYLLKGHRFSIQKVIRNSSHLLPNSVSELQRLSKDFPNTIPFGIVPNAIDIELFREENEPVRIKDQVLCVARFEGRKNQLRLIEAIKQTGLKLILIGNVAPNHVSYLNQCKEIANDQVQFIDTLDQEKLKHYYYTSKVHAMPSWFETTGLSSLEAAFCGCSLVVSELGDERDYFQDDVFYADPKSVESIKNAILKAVESDASKELKNRIEHEYTWVKTAKKTLDAYKKVLL